MGGILTHLFGYVIFQNYKKTLKCEVCEESESACLDFHHKNPKEKKFEIGSVINHYGKERILKEIKKCMVVCANCHRKIHKYGLKEVKNGSLAQLDRAPDYGFGGYVFKSRRSHKIFSSFIFYPKFSSYFYAFKPKTKSIQI